MGPSSILIKSFSTRNKLTQEEDRNRARQKPYYSSLSHPHIPASLQPYLPASQSHKTYLKSQAYALDKLNYSGLLSVIDTVESYLLLSSALAIIWELVGLGKGIQSSTGFPYLNGRGGWTLLSGVWEWAGRLAGGREVGEIRQSLVFAALLTVAGTVLSIPKSWYKTFVLEEKHGFNKTTRKTFIADQIKGALRVTTQPKSSKSECV